ncbi:gliding motility-associated-like protein [Saonia flava]|uniref:Gliding motility-associated-like protein n=1 Tax=Saonia flava TaxID=523696 RepID=A0A846QTX8_9FLAO|nr:T9SS type B sorting domain-containing protein [Saonia flava]NJB72416.1 gliding motility-associated-like protein [Saonia flava]
MYFKKTFFLLIILLCVGHISWSQTNIPPTVTATGDQVYCPLSQINIVTDIDIVDPDDTEIEALYIQISTGYEQGQDVLSLVGNHPNINTTWSASQGKLTLSSANATLASYVDLIAAVRDVFFESSSPTPSGEKLFSITVGDVNYLPSTDHYYEYVPSLGITWTEARTAAEGRTYFGLSGYLATITSAEEAQLTGEQISGAGWIGGSDAGTEGIWRWVTGPESGTVFWNGLVNGSSPNYANWNIGEPNQAGDEDYAHLTDPSVGNRGAWNDLSNVGAPNGPYQPKGYVVEYGGMPGDPILNISASTKISIASIDSISGAERCGNGSLSLTALSSSGTVQWYDAPENGNLLFTGETFTTPIISANTTYYAYASSGGCSTGGRTPVEAIVNPLPVISPSLDFKNCDEDGIADGNTDFNLMEANEIITNGDNTLTVTYHLLYSNAEAGADPINPSPFNNSTANTVYARIENSFGCHQVSTINLLVSTTAFPSGYMTELNMCDDDSIPDGFHVMDISMATTEILSQFPANQNLSVHYYRNLNDATLEDNEITQLNYTNETPNEQILYVRVESNDNGACFGLGPYLTLRVFPLPIYEVASEASVCTDSQVQLNIFNPEGNYTYQWTNSNGTALSNEPSVTVTSGGTYNVIATSELGCESITRTVQVQESNIAEIGLEDITVSDNSSNNTITINNENNNLGLGDYEFALDNDLGPYQDEPNFDMVEPGLRTLFIRDKNGCGIAQIEIGIVGYPRFFTPNNDGNNDTWQVLGVTSEYYPESNLLIYDRYGRLIVQVDPLGEGWDGFVNSTALPSTDYWFMLQLTDNRGNTHSRNGHFSLKR